MASKKSRATMLIEQSWGYLKSNNYKYDPKKKDILPLDKDGNYIIVKPGRKKKVA